MPGTPPIHYLRVWNAAPGQRPDVFDSIADAGDSNCPRPDDPDYSALCAKVFQRKYFAIYPYQSVNIGGQVALSALQNGDTGLNILADEAGDKTARDGILRPMIDNRGRIIVRNGPAATNSIALFDHNLQSAEVVASTAESGAADFSATGRAPGISTDGRVAAFYGDLTSNATSRFPTPDLGYLTGPGIFVNLELGPILRQGLRVAGGAWDGSKCTRPELGKDDTDKPLCFTTFEEVSRVAVTHQGSGSTVTDGDTVVIAFMATPSGAAKDGSFSAQRGLWTIRLQVEPRQPTAPTAAPLVYSLAQAQRVAQIGQTIGTGTNGRAIGDIALQGYPLAAAARQGDHQLTFWASTGAGDMVVRAVHRGPPVVFIPGIAGSVLRDNSTNSEMWFGVPGWTDRRQLSLDPLTVADHHVAATGALGCIFHVATSRCPNIGEFYGDWLDHLTKQGGFKLYDIQGAPERLTAAGCDVSQKKNRPNLFVFPYDWRQSNELTSKDLRGYINCVRQLYPNTQVDLLTHSMGGLVGRRYVLDYAGDHHVNNHISIAAPWLGAPKLPYVLETGDFVPGFVVGPDVQFAMQSIHAAHELMPDKGYYDIGSLVPLVSAGRSLLPPDWPDGAPPADFNFAPADVMYRLFDQKYPLYFQKPGTTAYKFHQGDHGPAQYDFRGDGSGVHYYHLFGVQQQADTIGQARAIWQPPLCYPRAEGSDVDTCDPARPSFEIVKIHGDGTVPVLSASRVGSVNFNSEETLNNRRIYPFVSPSVDDDSFYDHNGMLHNLAVKHLAVALLGEVNFTGGTDGTPVSGAPQVLMAHQPAHEDPGTLEQVVAATGALMPLGQVSPLPAGSYAQLPYVDVRIVGATNVEVRDQQGNTDRTDPTTGVLGSVPGLTIFQPHPSILLLSMSGDRDRTVSFGGLGQPIDIEIRTGLDGGSDTEPPTVQQLIHYRDVMLPSGAPARLHIGAAQIDLLHYDADGSGTFQTAVQPV